MTRTGDDQELGADIAAAVGLVAVIVAAVMLLLLFAYVGIHLAHHDAPTNWVGSVLHRVWNAPPNSGLRHALTAAGALILGAIALLFATVLRRLRRS